jgi:hypothetical protein
MAVARSPEPFTAAIGDEIVMLSPARGTYFGLNAVGSTIWELLATPRTVSSLCRELTYRFDVDERTCMVEVTAFLGDLERAGLVEVQR